MSGFLRFGLFFIMFGLIFIALDLAGLYLFGAEPVSASPEIIAIISLAYCLLERKS